MENKRDKTNFAERLEAAYKNSARARNRTHGRYVWIANKMTENGAEVSPESVRKWFAGLTTPRGRGIQVLAKILQVDLQWLETGVASQPERSVDMTVALQRNTRRGNVGPAHYVAGDLYFAGVDVILTGDVVIARAEGETYEMAVVGLEKIPDTVGEWAFRMPSDGSLVHPDKRVDGMLLVVPNAGHPPIIFGVMGIAMNRISQAGNDVQVTLREGPDSKVSMGIRTQNGEVKDIKQQHGVFGCFVQMMKATERLRAIQEDQSLGL